MVILLASSWSWLDVGLEPPSRGVPHAGHRSVAVLVNPQAGQDLSLLCSTCQATKPAAPSNRGKSRKSRVRPPTRSSRKRPAGPGASKSRANSSSQIQVFYRCISASWPGASGKSHPDAGAPVQNNGKALAVVEDNSHKPDPKREDQHTANDAVGLETQA